MVRAPTLTAHSNDMGCTTEPLGIPHAANELCALREPLPGTKSLQSQRATKLLQSSPVEAGSPLPVLKSEAGVDYAYSRTTDAAAHSPDSACTNAVVEAPANLWNLTAKMVGEALDVLKYKSFFKPGWLLLMLLFCRGHNSVDSLSCVRVCSQQPRSHPKSAPSRFFYSRWTLARRLSATA